jgi:anti-sigma regulatory factor (Ser/Thr protein kinase)
MGFGAGMGLVNIQRCVDKMELESQPGQGTKLVMKIHLDEQLVHIGINKPSFTL